MEGGTRRSERGERALKAGGAEAGHGWRGVGCLLTWVLVEMCKVEVEVEAESEGLGWGWRLTRRL